MIGYFTATNERFPDTEIDKIYVTEEEAREELKAVEDFDDQGHKVYKVEVTLCP